MYPMSQPASRPWTIDEFLAWERQQEERYEFVDGIIRMMVGGTLDHHAIAGNVFAALKSLLKGGHCMAFVEGVKVVAASSTMYPDVAVTCTPIEGKSDIVPDPVLIVEVLSRTTQGFDRGGKWIAYQTIESLRHYALISQDQQRVELYTRRAGGWDYTTIDDPGGELNLTSIGAAIPLATIYEATSLQRAGAAASG